ncbi:UPF0739 protein C1orf74 homolog [Argopecten irradians]|uniref:UPF0739 protein C1orf74 homolog n=1 Tax=Argopecten irradians TaxID=31199 RepID=UPI003720FA0B
MASSIHPRVSVDIRQFVSTYMGKKIKQYARELFTNIQLVDLHVKPSYLLDFGVDGIEKLVLLLEEMKRRDFITNSLNVLQLDFDFVIINPVTFKRIQSTELEKCHTIVDVSKSRNSPEVLCKDGGVFDQIKRIFKDVLPDNNHIKHFTVDCNSANLTTIFGVLLSYPIVYWFDNTDGVMANCLDMEPLESFKVTGWRHSDKCDHCVFSFSVPKSVFDDLESKVMKWFKVVFEETEWNQIFSDLKITHTSVQLDAVSL